MMKSKILFLAPTVPPYAGPEICSTELLENLMQKTSTIIHIRSNIQSNNSSKGLLTVSGILNFLKIYLSFLSYISKKEITTLYFLISSNKLGFFRDTFYIGAAKAASKKIIAHYHGDNWNGFIGSNGKIFNGYVRYFVKKIDYIIVLGEKIKNNMSLTLPGERIKVLHNGINLTKYRKDKHVEKSVFKVIFMGHLWFPKGFYDLIKAYKELYKKHSDSVSFHYAGERAVNKQLAMSFLNDKWKEHYNKESEKIVDEINEFINNSDKYNAKYLGIIKENEKIEFLNSADVFALPSYTEGFSMSCLEAVAAGLPIITTPVGAMEELIKDGVNGFIVPVGESNLIYEKLEYLIQNPDVKNTMSENNILHSGKYDINTITDKLFDILNLPSM